MSDPALPSVMQTFRAGLRFAARWIISGLSFDRFISRLADHPTFAHVPPSRIFEWYDFVAHRLDKPTSPISRIAGRFTPLLPAVPALIYVLNVGSVVSYEFMNASFIVFVVALFATLSGGIVMREGRISNHLNLLASTYHFGTTHRLGRCLTCGYNVTGIDRDECPECGANILVEPLLRATR